MEFSLKRSKIKGSYTYEGHKPITAKNKGEPQKMTHSSWAHIGLDGSFGVIMLGG